MLLIVDNYDSFVHNLARHLRCLGQHTVVVRNDGVTVDAIRRMDVQGIVLSPGPGTPAQAGRSLEIVRELGHQLPMLGVCLGHQTLAAAFGARVVRGREPVHGRASWVTHSGDSLFAGLPNPFRAGRYHSLVVDPANLPSAMRVTAWLDDGTVMALEHRERPIFGLQFHPESVLTQHGYAILAAFVRRIGGQPDSPPASELDDAVWEPPLDWRPPTVPITF
jgi:anthranilate synthase/aminodeoxychorismate synthase-like glutamine amidotransferase